MKHLFKDDIHRQTALSSGLVVFDGSLCVQCGICSYNCPIGIDVRGHVWNNQPINDSHCLACSQCIVRCPRGVLRLEQIEQSVEPWI